VWAEDRTWDGSRQRVLRGTVRSRLPPCAVTTLILGGAVIWLAAFLGGVVGFAYGLVALPLLLLLDVPLSDVIVINLMVGLITRVVVLVRRYGDIDRKRAALLIAGSPPGILLGTALQNMVDLRTVRVGAGFLTLVAVGALVQSQRRMPVGREMKNRWVTILAAGGLGGFLGSTTSLNGVPPALLLTGARVGARSLVADLAAYFVVGNLLTLGVLLVGSHSPSRHVWLLLAAWIPAGLLGNLAGIALGPRLPQMLFRRLTLSVVFVSGALSIVQAL
jgi:uncharacterized membrane protein YfcA